MKLFVITGTCGAGKSTVIDKLHSRLDSGRFYCTDGDGLGLNWWDYAGTDHEERYADDCLKEAVRLAAGRDVVFGSCMNPQDYFGKNTAPERVEASFFIALSAGREVIEQRLKDRPAERGFTTPESRAPHIEYESWFAKNRSKFQLFLDTSAADEDETADIIAAHIMKWA
ncbi:MAG: AAA family ATPase [Oscillospiraceae bacterium]|nr:AAA family ATPase [Oscillospiraceae bacterium]